MDPSKQMQEMARDAATAARKAGAQAAAVVAERNRTVDVQWRDGKLETLKEATTRATSTPRTSTPCLRASSTRVWGA